MPNSKNETLNRSFVVFKVNFAVPDLIDQVWNRKFGVS